ncbi:ATP-grasp domain-containing protein [Ureibacillus endophyticus]|uniref:ATP-grasp domain-containing protein n=1 Tax=Ureibacillus endophyticus TaxID=1978490 RepID=A0A494YZ05_9BACL|nr:ATP-grasp domain-containing protein [Lysinibacillus endophyticus]RKQ15464.1 ATP-grasp domain-containing protein [Lysinibacillus endophyticus]
MILSCGSRNKIVQYFKKELKKKGNVFATDCNELAPALYEADKYFIVPRIDEVSYLDSILSLCKNLNIHAVFSLIDPEICIIAEHEQKFKNIGTIPVVSSVKSVEMSFNKFKMYQYLRKREINTIQTYQDKDLFYRDLESGRIHFPVIVKPLYGSGSVDINKVKTKEEIEILYANHDNLIIQEFMHGVEYGADVYVDLISNEPVAIFTKEKIRMRAGETDKSVSVKDPKLFQLIQKVVKSIGYKGMIDIDIFKIKDEYFISEVNPRFGGGYPHAYESGINFPKMLINNLQGIVNENVIGEFEEGIYMMKYNEVKVGKLESN